MQRWKRKIRQQQRMRWTEKFNSSNNQNKRQELKFYLHETEPYLQMVMFTKLKERIILNIQSEIMNESDIAESICKGVILYLSNDIPIKGI